ncbi:MAG TPA: hypothetical protein VIM98_01840 [Dyella sp.]|uniref:hypothetical protein n=1 Tax=Dyella sp. TaxID=1869338 RepID=UPI002F91D090
MNAYLTASVAAVFILLVFGGVLAIAHRQRIYRRAGSVRHLLDLADRLEVDLKSCRNGLQQAHAVISLNPDLPAESEKEARSAIEAGLRSLLQQRIWIRDKAPKATQEELDAAVAAMSEARNRLRPLLAGLDRAQHDLDDAMREQIRREGDA